jgi:N-carbamoylputrescine amidase
VAQAGRTKDEVVVADLNLEEIEKVRATWQFYRDRRPDSYGDLTRIQTSGKIAGAAD